MHMGLQLATEALLQRGLEVGELFAADLVGAVDLRIGHARGGIGQHVVLSDDLGQRGQAAVLDDGLEEVLDTGSEGLLGSRGHDRDDLLSLGLGVIGELAQIGVLRHLGQRVELLAPGREVVRLGNLEQGFGVGPGDGGEFSHLQLRLQAGQQLGVDAGVDFALQDLLGTLDGQRGDLLAQGLTGTGDLLLGIGLGGGEDLGAFFVGLALGGIDDGSGTLLGVGDQLGGLGLGLGEFLGDLGFGAGPGTVRYGADYSERDPYYSTADNVLIGWVQRQKYLNGYIAYEQGSWTYQLSGKNLMQQEGWQTGFGFAVVPEVK